MHLWIWVDCFDRRRRTKKNREWKNFSFETSKFSNKSNSMYYLFDSISLCKVDDVWEDGPCRSCSCDQSSKRGICNKIECAPPPTSSDYVVVPYTKYGQCCPSYKKESCVYNETVYNAGSEWFSLNPCVSMSCKLDNGGEAYITESVKSCNTECPLVNTRELFDFNRSESKPIIHSQGWAYVPSANSCCGTCLQVRCVMQNKIYAENETWSYDNCTSFVCSKSEFNEVRISVVSVVSIRVGRSYRTDGERIRWISGFTYFLVQYRAGVSRVSEYRRLSGKHDLLRRVLRAMQQHVVGQERGSQSLRARKFALQPNSRPGDRGQPVPRYVHEYWIHSRIHRM